MPHCTSPKMSEIFPSYFSEYSSEKYWELFIIMNNYPPRSKTIFFIIFWLIYVLYSTVCLGHSDSTLYKVFFIFHLILNPFVSLSENEISFSYSLSSLYLFGPLQLGQGSIPEFQTAFLIGLSLFNSIWEWSSRKCSTQIAQHLAQIFL